MPTSKAWKPELCLAARPDLLECLGLLLGVLSCLATREFLMFIPAIRIGIR